MSTVSSVAAVPNNAAASFLNPETVRSTGKKNLDIDDFLKLITVQLTSQDPLKPMEDTQFISQMASFTSLEQMQTLSKDFKTFSSNQEALSAQSYLGKTVTVGGDNGDVTGIVTKVSFEDGIPLLTVNGTDYDLAHLFSVSLAAPTAGSSQNNSSSTQPANTATN